MIKPKLAIFLNLGDSFKTYHQSGRDIHWLNNYLQYYPKTFGKPLGFSYADELNPFPDLIKLFPNKTHLPRFIYTFLIPFIYFNNLRACQVLRVKQMLGVWPALLTKLLFKTPIVSTYGYDYTYFAHKEGHLFILPFIKLTEYLGLIFSDKIIVTNQEMYKKVSRIINPQKITIIPNGVNLDLFKPKPRLSSKTFHIVSVSRLVHQKNLTSLIQAVSRLKLNRPITLSILGCGPLKSKLISLAKKSSVNLKIIDSLPHDQLPQFLNKADLFILTSHHEGSPKALLEAMACALPCLVANKDYSQFVINSGHDGLLVTDFSKGIQQLFNQPVLAKKLGLNARQTIQKRFNNQTIIKQEINLLKSLIK